VTDQTQEKTLFEKIADREISADIIYEDEHCFAFRDIQPVAPVHILVVPRKPIPSAASIEEGDAELIGRLFLAARRVAEQESLHDGYRLVFNVGDNAGQSVDHLHLHVIGGRPMEWPPG
jgi:histidine triad (HIT) family protein